MPAQALARTPATLVGSEIDMASFVSDVQRMTVKELASEVNRLQTALGLTEATLRTVTLDRERYRKALKTLDDMVLGRPRDLIRATLAGKDWQP
jgi:hypothetical protein